MEHKSPGKELRQILRDVLTVRTRLGEMAEDVPEGPILWRIESARSKLDRIAREIIQSVNGLIQSLDLLSSERISRSTD